MTSGKDYVRQIDADGFRKKRGFWRVIHLDPWLFLLLIVLTLTGLSVLYSASDNGFHTLKRQTVFFAIGFVVMMVMAHVPLLFYKRLAPVLYLTGVILLICVFFFGVDAKGAKRWLTIPGVMTFQPSEVMKLAMPLTCAWYLSKRKLPPSFLSFLGVALLIGLPFFLIIIQPDLGTSILIASAGFFGLLLSGLSYWYLFWGGILFAISAWPIWVYVLRDYQKGRILTLLDPERDPFGAGWNIIQSKTAIGSGGLEGKGWMQGTQSQLNFLPESHTDFIIATLAEEFGFIGVVLLLTLYFLIIGRCLMIAWMAKTVFSKLLGGALTLTFFVYILVNMGMVSGLLPVVGVPLPLVSRGGTSIVTLMAGFGLIMAVAAEKQPFAK